MKVATNAPAMPSRAVRMNPEGLLGPGEMNRAMIPATRPMKMIQTMPTCASMADCTKRATPSLSSS
jgi:hypothetical protein